MDTHFFIFSNFFIFLFFCFSIFLFFLGLGWTQPAQPLAQASGPAGQKK